MMDIERFPTNETAKRMMSRVSPIYSQAYVAKWLYQVMGIEMEEARRYFEELRSQSFPETATWAISYWEQRYGLPIDDTLSIEARRQRITSKRGLRAPMNPARIEQIISDLCIKPCVVTEDNKNYWFYVSVYTDDDVKVNFDDIKNRIKKIKPSHLSFSLKLQLYPMSFVNRKSFTFKQFDMKTKKEVKNQFEANNFFIGLKIKNSNSISGTVASDSTLKLDGSFNLDGTKKLNATLIKEEL